jgi:putative membrane protein
MPARLQWQPNQKGALYIALAFHVSGFIAMGIFRAPSFVALTPLNLLLCLALIVYTHASINLAFAAFSLLAFATGFGAEWVGVNTGLLFGEYAYGPPLGLQWGRVPLLIGVQWLVTMYCCGVATQKIFDAWSIPIKRPLAQVAWAVLAALLATAFDWLLEPVAIGLGYWSWKNNEVPLFNYLSWFAVSFFLMVIFRFSPFPKRNPFGVHLLLIQSGFFLLMRLALSRPIA